MKQRKRMKAKTGEAVRRVRIATLIKRHGTLIYSSDPEDVIDFDAVRAAFNKIKAEVLSEAT